MSRLYYQRTIWALIYFLCCPVLMALAADPPVLSITPREIDFGDVGPDNVSNSLIYMKNSGGGSIAWAIEGPETWETAENQRFTGTLAAEPDYLRLSLRSGKSMLSEGIVTAKQKNYYLKLTLEAGGKIVIFSKELPAGAYRDHLKITSPTGTRTIFINFKVKEAKSEPQLSVEPARLDFGIMSPGKEAVKQIKISNKGRETVKWRILVPRPGEDRQNILPLKGRYVSFFNDDLKGGSAYIPGTNLKDTLDLAGKWLEQEGYPSAFGVNNMIKYRFSGTGISVYLWHGPEGGKLAAYIDDQLIRVYEGSNAERGREELPIIEGLLDGAHVLTLVNGEGRAIIEGVSVYGKELMRGNPGWIAVNPNSGTTTRETDYANIRIDTQQLIPGNYGEQIVLNSNRGDVVLEAVVEVRTEQTARIIDVYRFARNHNYLLTTNPLAEANRIQIGGYRKEGIAFRLFTAGTPGTTEFYRWYNSRNDDHFYAYVNNGNVKSTKDYVLEGSIGNIATSKLTGTRELYRWRNQGTGGHFYTTDPKGEGVTKKGYKFDGIAGYVR